MKERGIKRTFTGEVISDKMDKTRIVQVVRTIKHSFYGKTIKRTKKYAIDDRKNESHVGDRVSIIETRPLSKTKRWKMLKIVKQGNK